MTGIHLDTHVTTHLKKEKKKKKKGGTDKEVTLIQTRKLHHHRLETLGFNIALALVHVGVRLQSGADSGVDMEGSLRCSLISQFKST